jgi:L-iditol 2-dehydrogenase
MRALAKVAEGEGNLALLEVPETPPGPGQVKIKIKAGGICGTDVGIYSGKWPVKMPRILGHELSGVIVEVGEGVEGLSDGDRVTTETDAFVCGECGYCRSGNEHMCPQRKAIGTSTDGGFADYLTIRAAGVHRLPDNIPFDIAALSEPVAVAVHAAHERGQVQPGEWVVVIGPGTIGLLAAQVAHALGGRVVVAGLARHTKRFFLARSLGVERAVALDAPGSMEWLKGLDDGLGPHKVVECSGAPVAAQQGLQMVRKMGHLVLVGFFFQDVGLDLDFLINKEVALLASRGKRHSCWPLALEMLADGRVDAGALITHRFPFSAWEEAFEAAGQKGTKVVLEMD